MNDFMFSSELVLVVSSFFDSTCISESSSRSSCSRQGGGGAIVATACFSSPRGVVGMVDMNGLVAFCFTARDANSASFGTVIVFFLLRSGN